jgi:hypothetical protein
MSAHDDRPLSFSRTTRLARRLSIAVCGCAAIALAGCGGGGGNGGSGGANNGGDSGDATAQFSPLTPIVTFSGADGIQPSIVEADNSGDVIGLDQVSGNPFNVFSVTAGSHQFIANRNDLAGLSISSVESFGIGTADEEGNLYFSSTTGGTNGSETIYKFPSDGSAPVLVADLGTVGDAVMVETLAPDAQGNLFGVAYIGNDSNASGFIFVIRAGTASIQKLASFSGSGPILPGQSLTMDSSDDLYGLTKANSQGGGQILYELKANTSTLTTLATFGPSMAPTGLIWTDSQGNVFGVLQDGLYEIHAGSGTVTPLAATFPANWGNATFDNDGNVFLLYLQSGGANGTGYVGEISVAHPTLRDIVDLPTGVPSDSNELGSLTVDNNGNLYVALTEYPNTQGILWESVPASRSVRAAGGSTHISSGRSNLFSLDPRAGRAGVRLRPAFSGTTSVR